MKEQNEKQAIEELTAFLWKNTLIHTEDLCHDVAETVIKEGYRKQSVGCKFCGTTLYVKTVQHTMPLLAPLTRADELRHELLNLTGEIYLPLEAKFCPLCGARMKGGAE